LGYFCFTFSLSYRQFSNSLPGAQIGKIQDELDARNKELKKLSRQVDELEEINEQLKVKLVQDENGSKDDHVTRLENSIKNHEMRHNHSKIAISNLEKSISTYHEKIEFIEGVVHFGKQLF